MPAFEDIVLFIFGGGALFYLGTIAYQLMRRIVPSKRDTLAEAKQRLEQAHLDEETARLNKEAEKIYDHLYEDTLQEDVVVEDEIKHRRV